MNSRSESLHVVMLHGRPASGKLTIAKEISRRTGVPVFHNHLTVDLLLSVFEFGSPEFVRLRETIWLQVIDAALQERKSLLFTYNPETTVTPQFTGKLRELVVRSQARFHSIEIFCPWETCLARVEDESRAAYKKLKSTVQLQALLAQGVFDNAEIPSDFKVDTSTVVSEEATSLILRHLRAQGFGE